MPLPDTEQIVREWVRSRTDIVDLVVDRIWFALPKQDVPMVPAIVLYRVGGSPDVQEHDYPNMAFECWGQNKQQAVILGRTLAEAIQHTAYEAPFVMPNVGRLKGGMVNLGPVPSAGTSWAKRYLVQASFMIQGL